MSVSKGPSIHCGGRYPYGTPAARSFQHIGGTPWKSKGRIWQMFCRKAPSRWHFAELKLRACQIQRSTRLNRKQKKLTNLLIFTFPSIALRARPIQSADRSPAAWMRPTSLVSLSKESRKRCLFQSGTKLNQNSSLTALAATPDAVQLDPERPPRRP